MSNKNDLLVFGFFIPPEFDHFQICFWDGNDFWYANITPETDSDIQKYNNEIENTNNKWNVYIKYYDPKKIDHLEVKRMFDLIEEHSVVLEYGAIEVINNYLILNERNNKIENILN
jgi:hypothetical protein